MKTIAEKIANIKDYADISITANKCCVDTEDDYNEESTIFTFEDGSRLKIEAIGYTVSVM